MAILKVARLGHPILRRPADPLPPEEIRTPETQRFIDDMIETMREYNGVGLAAPQVHVSRQIAVIEVSENPRYSDAPVVPLTVLIDPVLTPLDEEMIEEWEGCLSIPDLRGLLPRHAAVHLKALGRQGEAIELVAKEFFARVLQHECDHLQGKVYIDRMRDFESLSHLQEWTRYWLPMSKPETE